MTASLWTDADQRRDGGMCYDTPLYLLFSKTPIETGTAKSISTTDQ